jgi:HlyD family secretion protein
VAQATVENSHAAVETARANANSAKANVERSQVALTDARRTLERNQVLLRQALIAQSDLDTAQTAYDSAVAQLKLSEAQYEASIGQVKSSTAQARLAEAQLAAAKAQVEQARAALQAAELDLEHTTIRSPVKGHRRLPQRRCGPNRRRESAGADPIPDRPRSHPDAGRYQRQRGRHRPVCEGQGATFTVDAYPNTTFTGRGPGRNAPITVQNVVTYNSVVIEPALRLKPDDRQRDL